MSWGAPLEWPTAWHAMPLFPVQVCRVWRRISPKFGHYYGQTAHKGFSGDVTIQGKIFEA
jgi:hypothetical protein